MQHTTRLKIAGLAGILTLSIAGCGYAASTKQVNYSKDTYGNEARITEYQQSILDTTQPAPKLSYSLQRANLIKRLKWMNNPNQVSYIYLFSTMGTLVSFYVVKGAITSLNEHLTTQTQLVEGIGQSQYGPYSHVVNSPSLDGTYGSQGGSSTIFFYDEFGAYIQWSGPYLWSSQPLTLHTQPLVTQPLGGKP